MSLSDPGLHAAPVRSTVGIPVSHAYIPGVNSDKQTPDMQHAKLLLRARIREELIKLSPEAKTAAAARMRTLIQSQAAWRYAGNILLFAPLPDEPDLWPLIAAALAAKKRVMLPRFDSLSGHYVPAEVCDVEHDIQTGRFGIREPTTACAEVSLNRLDSVLVPGVAFDVRGGRLGRGKGFYDRLLAGVRGTKCGVAFDEQIVDAVPVGPQDIRLNSILTPTRWIET